jgi:DNA-binding NtrC family response regulator
MMARILLIDDDRSLREVVGFVLTEAGHEVLSAGDGKEGLRLFAAEQPDLVLTDIRMPGFDGMEVLRRVREFPVATQVPVVVLTAYGTVEQAVAAMKAGAFTYLLKPFDRDELRLTVEQALRTRALEADNRELRRLLRERSAKLPLIYVSPLMAELVARIRQVAPADVTVLVSGESGTGKELVARALHDLSPRWDRPFVTVDCGAIPAELMESELFGHERGAFTGAHTPAPGRIRGAEGGTLFLDEIGELPSALQPKLLRVLETRMVDPVGGSRPVPVDFRLIAATNCDLTAAVADGRFRADLYYRLEVVRLEVPPLRAHSEDVPILWEHFTRLHGGKKVRTAPGLLRRLQARPWRGNVRELKNLNQRLLVLRRGDVLEEEDLDRLDSAVPISPGGGESDTPGMLPDTLTLPELEKERIRRALARQGGNKSRAAAELGVPRHVLLYRLRKYGL